MMTTTTSNQQQQNQQDTKISNSDMCIFENEYSMEEYYSTSPNENHHHHQGALIQKDFNPTFYNPFETKHRRRTSRTQYKLLESSFQSNTKPNATMRRWLAQKLGMTPRSVQVWFQNRRAKAKSQLKRQYSSSSSSSHDYEEHDDRHIDGNNSNPCSCFISSTDQSHCCHNNQQQQYQCSPLTPLSCFSLPINDEVHQWQLTSDPLSMWVDPQQQQQQQQQSPPDLMPWYPASSPISSPLPSSPSYNTYYQHTNISFNPNPIHKESFHQLADPIFDFQSPPMLTIPQQPQQPLDPLNVISFL